jgi:hypothetical protein
MTDLLYEKLVKRFEEVTSLPPQQVGPLTPIYKEVTKRLKVMPWFTIGLVSILVVFALYVVFGSSITFLVSSLQRGF